MLWVGAAVAGTLYEARVREDALALDPVRVVGDAAAEALWPDRPLELVAAVDLSGSVDRAAARRVRVFLRALRAALLERPLPDDRLGISVFAGRAYRWLPMTPLASHALPDWLDAVAPVRLPGLDDPPIPACPEQHKARIRSAPPRPDPVPACAIGVGTHAGAGLRDALDQLGGGDPLAQRVVVLVWDGGEHAPPDLADALAEAARADVHVFSVGVGPTVLPGGLVARGAGDAYDVAAGAEPLVAERIARQLRFPLDPGEARPDSG